MFFLRARVYCPPWDTAGQTDRSLCSYGTHNIVKERYNYRMQMLEHARWGVSCGEKWIKEMKGSWTRSKRCWDRSSEASSPLRERLVPRNAVLVAMLWRLVSYPRDGIPYWLGPSMSPYTEQGQQEKGHLPTPAFALSFSLTHKFSVSL